MDRQPEGNPVKPLVLVACEYSGRVRDAFAAMGCEAWSCDFLPTESPGNHIQGVALEAMGSPQWDLIIAHPTCTYLCNSGVRWLASGGKIDLARHRQMMAGSDFFAACYWSNDKRVCVENPVMHGYAKDYLQSAWKVPTFTQSIQPWQHGDGEKKRTCLWLRGLPPLVPSNIVPGRKASVHLASPGPNRWKERSRTFPGIAKAMATQWAPLLFNS